MKNLKITGNLVVLLTRCFAPGVITLFAGFIIPDATRHNYVDNLLGGPGDAPWLDPSSCG